MWIFIIILICVICLASYHIHNMEEELKKESEEYDD